MQDGLNTDQLVGTGSRDAIQDHGLRICAQTIKVGSRKNDRQLSSWEKGLDER